MVKLLLGATALIFSLNLFGDELKTLTIKEFEAIVESPYIPENLTEYEIKKPKFSEK